MQLQPLRKIKFTLVFNRENRLNLDGTALVTLRAYQGGKNRYFSTGVYLKPEHWDERSLRVKDHPLKAQYNRHLQDFLHHFEAYEFTAIQKYGRCPLRLLDHATAPEDPAPASFTKFCWEELKRPDITPATRRAHRCTLNLLGEFRKEVFFDEIDVHLVTRFDRFMHRREMRLNKIHKHHRFLKAYINRAILFGHLPGDGNPYRQFKPRQEEPERVFLLPAELARLEALEIPSSKCHLEQIRKIFLLCCWTGLRFSDVSTLARPHLEETAKGLQVRKRLKKNGKQLTLPLWLLFKRDGVQWSKPEEIVREALAGRDDDKPLFRISNQYLNRSLKELAALAGIKKKMTSHVARRTFATAMATKVKVPVLQRLLSHSQPDITMIYVKLANSVIEEELEKIDWS
ncbi:MAG: site-specific integrase [Phaeodactylibacter sp.]|nr:site-specific integrase [Phaeodactylibacter sp.]